MKKNDVGDPKYGNKGVVGKMVRKIEMNGPEAENDDEEDRGG